MKIENKTLEAKVNQKLIFNLSNYGTAGYAWRVEDLPPGIILNIGIFDKQESIGAAETSFSIMSSFVGSFNFDLRLKSNLSKNTKDDKVINVKFVVRYY